MDLFVRLLCLTVFALASAADDAACAMQMVKGLASRSLGLAETVQAVDTSFVVVEGADGEFCYNATARTRGDYVTYDTVSTRTQCQDLCATDAKCNFYGWYEGKSKCGSCHLYESCQFRRQSACTGSDKPMLYKKRYGNTKRDEFNRAYDVDLNINGMYCDGSEIMTIPEATFEQCRGVCSRLSDCWFLAHYGTTSEPQKDEDVKSDSCSIQCRLFKDCTNPKFSVCRPNPAVYAAAPPEPELLGIGEQGFGGVAITASGKAIFPPQTGSTIGILDIATGVFSSESSGGKKGWLGCAAVGNVVVFVPFENDVSVGIFNSSDKSLKNYSLPSLQNYRFAGGAAVGHIVVFAPLNWDKIGMFNVQKYQQNPSGSDVWANVNLSSDLPSKSDRFVGAVVVDGLVVFVPFNQDHVVTFDVNAQPGQQVKQYATQGIQGTANKFRTGAAVGSKVYFAPFQATQVGVFDVQDKTFALAGEAVNPATFYSAAAISSMVYFAPDLGGTKVLVFNTQTNETELVELTLTSPRYRFGATDPTRQTAIFAPFEQSPGQEGNILLIRSPRP